MPIKTASPGRSRVFRANTEVGKCTSQLPLPTPLSTSSPHRNWPVDGAIWGQAHPTLEPAIARDQTEREPTAEKRRDQAPLNPPRPSEFQAPVCLPRRARQAAWRPPRPARFMQAVSPCFQLEGRRDGTAASPSGCPRADMERLPSRPRRVRRQQPGETSVPPAGGAGKRECHSRRQQSRQTS